MSGVTNVLNLIFVLHNSIIAPWMLFSLVLSTLRIFILFGIYETGLKVVPLMHSAAVVHAADKLITPQGDLNANWFSILTVEGVAVQLHRANI